METQCLFCLEDVKENNQNSICQCKYHYHQKCIDLWFQQKQQLECPICHTVAVIVRYPSVTIGKVCGFCCCCSLFSWIIMILLLEFKKN